MVSLFATSFTRQRSNAVHSAIEIEDFSLVVSVLISGTLAQRLISSLQSLITTRTVSHSLLSMCLHHITDT